MPTFLVETNVTTDEFRKRVAKKMSFWLQRQDVQVNHVIMKFYELTPECAFSGPFPFNKFPKTGEMRTAFAFITCQISQDRSPEFRLELARKLVEALQPEVGPEKVFIAFQLVNPEHHFIGTAL